MCLSHIPSLPQNNLYINVCVMYSGEYDVCDVTLSVHPHRAAKLKSLLGHGGNRTRDLWDTSRCIVYSKAYIF